MAPLRMRRNTLWSAAAVMACCLTSSSTHSLAEAAKVTPHLRKGEPATQTVAAGDGPDTAPAAASAPLVDDNTTAATSSPDTKGLSPLEIESRIGPKVGRIKVPNTDYTLSRISYGGLHWPEFSGKPDLLQAAVEKALSLGITTMDLADVYGWYQDGHGRSNDVFAQVLKRKPELRDRMELVCKWGIRLDGGYHVDTTPGWIWGSINRYLELFNTTHCDVFMIHNPNPNINNWQVAQTFKEIYDQGKVKMFGVSNFHEWEYKPLQEAMKAKGIRLSVHEMETSVLHPDKIKDGTVDFAHDEDMIVLGWGPLGGDAYGGRNLLFGNPGWREKKIVGALDNKGKEIGGPGDAVAVAWLLHHKARIIPILGTTKLNRIESQSVGAEALNFSDKDYNDIMGQLNY